MAAQSYSSLFGTNGAAKRAVPTQDDDPKKPKTYQQTFSQMQQAGQARPAPAAPQTGTYQPYQGSQQAQAARAPMLQSLQAQLAQPTRFDTDAFNQIRQAQQQNLNAEFGAQRSQLEEEMARRGLSASSIGAGRYGDLAGQQARAQATMDAELLQQAAQTQAQDRLASLQAAGQFADLAGSQDLAEFEANRVGQAQRFQESLQAAQFGQGQSEFDRAQALQAANLEQTGGLSGMDLALRQQLGMGALDIDAARLGQAGEQFGQSLAEQQAARQQQGEQFGLSLNEQQAGRLQQYGISTQELGLRAQQLQQEASLQGRSLDIRQAQDLAQNELEGQKISQQNEQFTQNLSAEDRRFSQTLDEQRANRLQTLGISNTELEQRARQITQQDRSLSLQEARDAAEVDFRAESLMQQAALEGNRITLDTARFEAERDFRVDQLTQQQDQFTATLGNEEQRFVRTLAEQQAGRIQQLGLSTRELDQRATQIADDARLRGETLSLQQARDEAEIEARANAIASQEAMQGRQITSDEARNAALLAFQRDQLNVDATLRRDGIAVDRERLAANEKQFADDLALRTTSLAQQQTQFDANLGLDQRRMTLDQQRFQLQLAAALAALSPEALKKFNVNRGSPNLLNFTPPPGGGGTPGNPGSGDGSGNEIVPNQNVEELQRTLSELFASNSFTS